MQHDERPRPLIRRLYRLWHWLTEPAAPVQEAGRRQAQLLASLLVPLIAILAVELLRRGLSGGPVITRGIGVAVFGVAYGLSRTGRYRWGAALTLATVAAIPFVSVLTQPARGPYELTTSLVWCILTVLVSNLFFSLRITTGLASANIMAVLALPLFIPGVTLPQLAFPLGFVSTLSAMIMIAAVLRHFDLQQIARQSRALAAREEQLRRITDNTRDVIGEFDPSGVIRYTSPSCRDVLGYESQALLGRAGDAVLDLLHPDEAQQVRAWFDETLASGQASRFEHRFIHADGHEVWMETVASALVEDDGAVTGVITISRDITGRKEAEAALREAHDQLELRVKERTAELEAANAELHRQIAERQQAEEALAQERNLLRIVIDNLPAQVYAKDRHSRFTLANVASARSLRATPDAVLGKTDLDFFPPEEAESYHADEREIFGSGQPLRDKIETYTDPDTGEQRWLSTNKIPFRDAHDQIVGLVGINHDITERMRAEAALREAHDQLEARVAERTVALQTVNRRLQQELAERGRMQTELETREVQQAAVAWLGQRALTGVSLTTLMQEATILVSETLNVEYVQVMELLPDEDVLFMRAGVGWDAGLVGRMKVDAGTDALCGYTLATSEPVIVEDLAQETRFGPPPLLHQQGVVSSLSVLIHRPYQVRFGVLGAHTAQPRAFTQDDIHFMQSIANVLAAAITRRRAEDAEREHRALAEALRDTAAVLNSTLELEEVLERILTHVARVVPHDAANIMLIEGDQARPVGLRGYEERGVTNGVEGLRLSTAEIPNLMHMMATQEPLVLPDTRASTDWVELPEARWVRSYLGAPICRSGGVIGFIHLDSAAPGFFTAGDAERLQAFADQAATAIENAQLYAEIRRYAGELAALSRATSFLFTSFSASSNLTDLCGHVARAVASEFGQVYCVVRLVDEAQHTLVPVARAGVISGQPPVGSLPLDGPGLTVAAARTGQVIYAPDVAADPRYLPSGARTGSELVVPLRTAQGVVGVLDLQAADLDAFAEDDRRVLAAFAERAAAAVENMHLYEEVRRYAGELEQRVAERTAELAQERAQLQAILDSMGEGVVYSEDVSTRYVNEALVRMTGYNAAELLNEPFARIISNTAETRTWELPSVNGAAPFVWTEEARLRRKDGDEFEAALTTTLLDAPEVRPLREVTLIRDISQEKALRGQKDRFIANASHELRTPITNLKLYLHLIRRDPRKVENYLHVLTRVTEHMENLAEDLLDLSRFERGEIPLLRQDVDLSTLLADVLAVQRLQAEQKGVRLTNDLPAAPLTAHLDPNRITQVVNNLVVNAINYTPRQGQVQVRLVTDEAARRAIIRVQDNGVGIAPDALPHIFEPFYRASEGSVKGTGLGLTIAQEIVRLHGGEITVESEVGRGSVFSITLPL